MAAAVPPVFALAPALVDNNPIDYSTSEGRKLHNKAIEALSVEFDCSAGKLKVFLSAFSDQVATQGWENLMEIPPDINNPAVTHNLVTEYGRLSLEAVTAHVNTYIGAQTRQAQNSYNMYHCIMNSLNETARQKVMLLEDQYTVNGIRSGACLLKVVIRKSYLDSNATTKMIRKFLSNLKDYMTSVDSDIEKFNDHVQDLIDSLTARGQTTHDLLANLFEGYAAASDDAFVKYIGDKESDYDEGQNFTPEELMQLAYDKYATLKEKGEWMEPSEDQKKIIALEAKLEQLQKKTKAITKKDGGQPGNKTPKKPDDKHKDKEKKKGKSWVEEWMLKQPPGGKGTKEVNGKQYWWCPKHARWVRHKPEDCKLPEKPKSENQPK